VADLVPFARVEAAGRPRWGSTARRGRRGNAIRTAVVTSVVLVAGTGVAAAAGFIDAHTGVFGEPGMTENDTSEYLDSAGVQVPELMRSYTVEMPLAPGYDVEPLIERFTTAGHGMVQEAGLRGQVFAWSSCSWELTWLDARAAGDSVAQAEATAVLGQIPDWPIVPLVDGDGSLTATVREVADAAAAGDPGPIQQDTAVNCDSTFLR
jgi:hypothetical protein